MPKADRSIDKTHLSIDQAEARGFIHRDYIAHCLRWTHVCKHLTKGHLYKQVKILDVGCGKEVPLAKLMYSARLIPTEKGGCYVGIDANKLSVPEMFNATGKFPITLYGQTPFPKDIDKIRKKYAPKGFDVITCFEVLEHVEPQMAADMLSEIRESLAKNGRAFLSTPCYDHQTGAAQNHINEMTYTAFGAMIEFSGLQIENVWGTFASQKDYKPLLEERRLTGVFEELSNYYDSNYLATVFAPLFPQASRNCLWVVKVPQGTAMCRFPELEQLNDSKQSSSSKWSDFVKKAKWLLS